jgi:hypothetical protein
MNIKSSLINSNKLNQEKNKQNEIQNESLKNKLKLMKDNNKNK